MGGVKLKYRLVTAQGVTVPQQGNQMAANRLLKILLGKSSTTAPDPDHGGDYHQPVGHGEDGQADHTGDYREAGPVHCTCCRSCKYRLVVLPCFTSLHSGQLSIKVWRSLACRSAFSAKPEYRPAHSWSTSLRAMARSGQDAGGIPAVPRS